MKGAIDLTTKPGSEYEFGECEQPQATEVK